MEEATIDEHAGKDGAKVSREKRCGEKQGLRHSLDIFVCEIDDIDDRAGGYSPQGQNDMELVVWLAVRQDRVSDEAERSSKGLAAGDGSPVLVFQCVHAEERGERKKETKRIDGDDKNSTAGGLYSEDAKRGG